MENIPYPLRINRYLALSGVATRREADAHIKKKNVLINGRVAVLGDIVHKGDTVTLKKIDSKKHIYVAYHKPQGIIAHSPSAGEKSIEDDIRGRIPERVFPVGRLDKDSRGLIILTNDGRITEKLLSPERTHEKEYTVAVDKPIASKFLTHMKHGVNIEGYATKPSMAKKTSEREFSIVLTEGKKHQLRRMCAAEGYAVRDIKRVRIMNIELGSLASGQFRIITGGELKTFLALLGIGGKKDKEKKEKIGPFLQTSR